MLYINFTEKLTVLQDLIVTKVENNKKEIHIYGEMKRKPHKCPCCGEYTDNIHDYRKYFKKSRFLLTKRFDKFTDEQKQQVNIMLYVSPSLSTAHFYKEEFLKILDCKDHDSAKKKMSEWIDSAFDCGLPRFKKCAETMINWTTGILNSFSSPVTNAFTKGCNNKIKVLKRNAYGYQNFNRFRNRILHMFAYKNPNYNKQATAF